MGFHYTWNINLNIFTAMALKFIAIALLIMAGVSAIELSLVEAETCMEYKVDEGAFNKMFYFHYNNNLDTVAMVLYQKGSRAVLRKVGEEIGYPNNIQMVYNESGVYSVCFEKITHSPADISFDIIDEESISAYAGKEELAKVSRRISEFLMDIKRVGFTFKAVLEQHNSRKEKIRVQQNSYGLLLFVKVGVMACIVAIQVLAVRKIFN